jgi:hypothetical protein
LGHARSDIEAVVFTRVAMGAIPLDEEEDGVAAVTK